MKKTTENEKESSGQEEFPGYPRYPASEDIVNRQKRVPMDADGITMNDEPKTPVPTASERSVKKGKSESDVTKSDLQALRSEENTFKGDDEELEGRVYPVDFAGDDLDIPGAELDDEAEMRGSEDEENNSYSLGGDNHEDLEEDRSTF